MVSGFKKDNKNKIEFVKDKKQLIMLVVAFIILIVAVINMFRQMNPSSNVATDIAINSETGDMSTPISGNMSQETQEIVEKTNELKQELKELNEDSQIVSDIDIIPEKSGLPGKKMVSIEVDNSTNVVNPFLPTDSIAPISPLGSYANRRYSSRTNSSKVVGLPKLPKITYPVHIAAPPTSSSNFIDTSALELNNAYISVSGIMYDNYSPSAIIKVYNTDFFVKRGDVIKGLVNGNNITNGFKIIDIKKDFVIIQSGRNIFWGYIGQPLVQGDLDYRKNISNLDSKFGGNSVSIRVKR